MRHAIALTDVAVPVRTHFPLSRLSGQGKSYLFSGRDLHCHKPGIGDVAALGVGSLPALSCT